MLSEEKLFLAKFNDKAMECDKKCILTNTDFMDMHMHSVAKSVRLQGDVRVIFYSPFSDCERVLAIFLPEYIEAAGENELKSYFRENPYDDPVRVIRVTKDKFSPSLTHRDYLGALMALGIKREMTGDIIVDGDGCYIVCLEKTAAYIKENLLSAGRATLKTEIIDYYALDAERNDTKKEVTFTVSSLRLDSVVKNGFNLSRTDAAEKITQGLVYVNDIQAQKIDKKIFEGDKIVLRHSGRFLIKDCSGRTKKGRTVVKAET